ncbi:hypothetical protein [uncultured Duncaniella sp.]|nr:hypothetical protein [uncultured Duncaniella sp.]
MARKGCGRKGRRCGKGCGNAGARDGGAMVAAAAAAEGRYGDCGVGG